MKQAESRRPSPHIPISNGLWSLWQMLEQWGYFYTHIGLAIGYSEAALIERRIQLTNANSLAANSGEPLYIRTDEAIVSAIYARCGEIARLAKPQDLGAVPRNAEVLKAKIEVAKRKPLMGQKLNIEELLNDVERIKNDMLYILESRLFYSLTSQAAEIYGKPELFGPKVAKKFSAACADIEWAGNCLALGQPTACVLHLNRAMEIALRKVAVRLKGVTVGPKAAMGDVLNSMMQPIKDLPVKTNAQKRKKEKWSECALNLSHVKMAWRDPGSHGRQNYDDKQARDIFERVQGFMQQLATLL